MPLAETALVSHYRAENAVRVAATKRNSFAFSSLNYPVIYLVILQEPALTFMLRHGQYTHSAITLTREFERE